jgi:hypothetical protein
LHANSSIDVVAYQGLEAPSTRAVFSSFASASLNSAGAVAFAAVLSDGGTAIYQQLGSATPSVALALFGRASPVIGGSFGSLSSPQILDDGSIVFKSTIVGGPAYYGEFRGVPGSLKRLMSTADNLPVGAFIRMSRFEPASDLKKRYSAFTAQYSGGAASLFATLTPAGTPTKLAAEGEAITGIGVITSLIGSPFVNSEGQAVVKASFDSGREAVLYLKTPLATATQSCSSGKC